MTVCYDSYLKEIEYRIQGRGLLDNWDLPTDLKDLIKMERDADRIVNFRICYCNNLALTPEARKEIEDLLILWSSPLVQALL